MFRRIFLVLAVLGAVAFAGSTSSAEAGHGCYRSSYYGGHWGYYRSSRYHGYGPSYYYGSPSYYYGGHHGHHGHSGISISIGF